MMAFFGGREGEWKMAGQGADYEELETFFPCPFGTRFQMS